MPTAPIPVHTAYAVPIGKVFKASVKRTKLESPVMTVSNEGINRENPAEDFIPKANAISKIPATTSNIQAIIDHPIS